MASDEFAAQRVWRTWSDIAGLFDGPEDPAWSVDRDSVELDARDPDRDQAVLDRVQ